MIKTHVASRGNNAGSLVRCSAKHQCRISSEDEHVFFETSKEVNEYNELKISEKYGKPGEFSSRDKARLKELEETSAKNRFLDGYLKGLRRLSDYGGSPFIAFSEVTGNRVFLDRSQSRAAEVIGSFDFAVPGSYEFDAAMVLKDLDGGYYLGTDSGCSCPVPFENYGSLEDWTGPLSKDQVLEELSSLYPKKDVRSLEGNFFEFEEKHRGFYNLGA